MPVDPVGTGSREVIEKAGHALDLFHRIALIALMYDRHEPQTCAPQGRLGLDSLPFQTCQRNESPFGKKLGGEAAKRWVKPPGFGQKDALAFTDSSPAVEQVGKRRNV